MVDGEVQVVGPSGGPHEASDSAGKEEFEVPSQLRQQFIEVSIPLCACHCRHPR